MHLLLAHLKQRQVCFHLTMLVPLHQMFQILLILPVLRISVSPQFVTVIFLLRILVVGNIIVLPFLCQFYCFVTNMFILCLQHLGAYDEATDSVILFALIFTINKQENSFINIAQDPSPKG